MRLLRTTICVSAAVVLLSQAAIAGHCGGRWWSPPTCWQPAPACHVPQAACYGPNPSYCQPAPTCCVPPPTYCQRAMAPVQYTGTGWACPVYKAMTWTFNTGNYCTFYAVWCSATPQSPFPWDAACNLSPLGCREGSPCVYVGGYAPAPGHPHAPVSAPVSALTQVGGPKPKLPNKVAHDYLPTPEPDVTVSGYNRKVRVAGKTIDVRVIVVVCLPQGDLDPAVFHVAVECDDPPGDPKELNGTKKGKHHGQFKDGTHEIELWTETEL